MDAPSLRHPWLFLYYVKALDRLDGTTSTAAMEVVEAALKLVIKLVFPNGPPEDVIRFAAQHGTTRKASYANGHYVHSEESRFVAQFVALAEKMTEVHYAPDGPGRKRDRDHFEADHA